MYTKKGVEYRPIECYFNDNMRLLIANTGLSGFAIYNLLLNKIYGEEGYFVKWTSEVETLFAFQLNVKGQTVSECIKYLIARGFFDKDMFDKYNILTSREIQLEYLRITKQRKRVNQWHTPQYVFSDILNCQNDSELGENSSEMSENARSLTTEKEQSKEQSEEKQSDNKSNSESESIGEMSPAMYLSQKLNKKLSNKKLQIDTTKVDIDKLCEAVSKSIFLQQANNLGVDWLVEHYDEVIRGDYKTIDNTKKNKNNGATLRQREYTKEELSNANLMSNIEDWL